MDKELGIEGSGEARSRVPFELKGLGGLTGTIGLTANEKRVAEDRRDRYWIYLATGCDAHPRLHVHKDPASIPWHEVTKVAHYYLAVNAMTRPMQVRQDKPPYGGKE